jgi:hypothetical protein
MAVHQIPFWDALRPENFDKARQAMEIRGPGPVR